MEAHLQRSRMPACSRYATRRVASCSPLSAANPGLHRVAASHDCERGGYTRKPPPDASSCLRLISLDLLCFVHLCTSSTILFRTYVLIEIEHFLCFKEEYRTVAAWTGDYRPKPRRLQITYRYRQDIVCYFASMQGYDWKNWIRSSVTSNLTTQCDSLRWLEPPIFG